MVLCGAPSCGSLCPQLADIPKYACCPCIGHGISFPYREWASHSASPCPIDVRCSEGPFVLLLAAKGHEEGAPLHSRH